MDKIKAEKITKIIAQYIDYKDQIIAGIPPNKIDYERWEYRYTGVSPVIEDYVTDTIACNRFRVEVDMLVSRIMCA